jgi:hypothetical protein
MAIVAAAVIRIGRRALKNPVRWCIAGAALAATSESAEKDSDSRLSASRALT